MEAKLSRSWQDAIANLVTDIAAHPELSKSEPPLDYDFMKSVVLMYRDVSGIRQVLNEIDLWIKSGNTRSNYRATLSTWLRNRYKEQK